MKKIILSISIFFSVLLVKADEGMWLLSLLNQNFEKMQEMGLQLTLEEIYSINNSSMKDAVVRFGGGCTAEIISKQGLLLTNHHCGYGTIQSLSTRENNILQNGFWAKSLNEEIPCEGLSVMFFIRMEDVTDMILADLNNEMSEQQRRDSITERSKSLENENSENGKYVVRIANMFNGNFYYMFIYQTYNDIRLVGTPPESMGKFGGDTDNWTWPRHTADFSMFRVYTDKEGNPASYSEENIPLVPKWYFPISTAGVQEGDFAMIMGFPGSTDRFLTSYGVKMAIEEKNPTIVQVRDVKLSSWRTFRRADPVINLQYASKYAGIANYWKYYIAQTQQLINNNVWEKKKQIENDFQIWVNKKELKEYDNVLSNINKVYQEKSKLEKLDNLYGQAIFSGPEIFSLAATTSGTMTNLLKKQEDGTINETEKNQLTNFINSFEKRAESFFKNYNVEVDKATTAHLLELFYKETTPEQRPQVFNDAVEIANNDFNKLTENLYEKTLFADKTLVENFLQNPNMKTLEQDLVYIWYGMFRDFYKTVFEPASQQNELLSKNNRLYIKGLMEMNPDKLYAPNANGQIRLTYGRVGGYPIKDGLYAKHYTTLAGVLVKEDPDSYEFKVPQKLKELYQNKDYGIYAEDGEIRVNFLTNNDITGGNSGSPVINGKGHLIGCAFDGNYEAMSGDIFFETELQRCINVDIRYILFVIDKFGDAKHIVDEMTLVNE